MTASSRERRLGPEDGVVRGSNVKCSATGPYLVVHKLQGEGRLAHAATAHHDYLVENQGRLVLVLTGGHGCGLQTKGWRWEGEARTSVFRLISQWELSNNGHHLRVNIFVQRVRKKM